MKLNFTSLTLVAALFAGTAMAQSTKHVDETYSIFNRFENAKKGTSEEKTVTGTLSTANGYEADMTLDIPFVLDITNLDDEWVDSLSITFPAGFTINSVSNDDVFFLFDDPNFDDEEFNGIDGQTVTWGDNDNNWGGIAAPGTYNFTINVTVDAGISGEQTGDFFASGDQFSDPAADLAGTFSIAEGAQTSVFSIIADSDDHNTLETALLASGLNAPLEDLEADLTVFAPTDAAFSAIQEVVDELLMDPTGALANVLLYHVVAGTALSGDLSDGQEVLTLQGETVTVAINGSVITINGAEVTMADIPADNGVVHVIDAVLVPSTCTVFAGGPYNDFTTAFGGAPVEENGVCPVNAIDAFENWASEGYIAADCVEGVTYEFGLQDGASGAWDPAFVIIDAATGEVIASETEGLSITWLCPADGDYIWIIQEEGLCGNQSDNTGTDNGFPYMTCTDPLSSTDFVLSNDLDVFPNPTNNQFTLDIELNASERVTVDLINIVGQVVKSVDLGTRSAGLNREYIDVNDLSEGIYFMNLTVGATQGTVKVQVVR
ncbi:fasciclin domain-containing protein [Cryomorphaceae bacterium 1068]|nr:fasciclin domain-containing protein [Cryomorphaceae bacterium 1068]